MHTRGCFIALLVIVSAWLGVSPAEGAGFDGSVPILCATTRIIECDSVSDCEETTLESVDLPRFFKIDLAKKSMYGINAIGQKMAKETSIKSVQRADGKLMLQGVQVRAWSLLLSEETGNMTLTASDEEAAFVLFGACTIP